VISGVHVVIYSKDADTDRTFFKKVLGLRSVDAGGGWLIFAVPAAELAFHPDENNDRHELYFTCNNIKSEMALLKKKGATFGDTTEERWGVRTTLLLPGGGKIGIYEPKHLVTFNRHVEGRRNKTTATKKS
jgi:catechol 2,3-dioxygenase-like lactoylglutathione lyase family enzyme